jgi:vitellogenic carboxypeptidase-like protein
MMNKIKFLLLLSAIIGAVQCICNNEEAYLTPYIESNNLVGGKLKATVLAPELLAKGITSYAGYFNVNKTCNSNMFFWFFPAQKKSESAPVILWLQGGPGASSLYGLFMENGPVSVNAQNYLDSRQYTWTKDYNVLYIDNPVGAGFSYTNIDATYSCFAKNKDDVQANLFETVRQFFSLFKELRDNPFYITGESYAGKYVPILGHAIHINRNHPDPSYRINLKGVQFGNGVTDPVNQLGFGEYYYQLGYISQADLNTFTAYQNAAISYINAGNYLVALEYAFSLVNTPTCLFNNLTGFTSPYNFLNYNGYDPTIDRVSAYLTNANGIKKCLNVGTRTFTAFTGSNLVIYNLESDILTSVASYVAELANFYKVVIYTGQLDLLINVVGQETYVRKLNYNGAAQLATSTRAKYIVNNNIAGWWFAGGNLYFVIVHDAGHMVPVDQPAVVYDMLDRLTSDRMYS